MIRQTQPDRTGCPYSSVSPGGRDGREGEGVREKEEGRGKGRE